MPYGYEGGPRALLLTPGSINDIAIAPTLVAEAGRPFKGLLGDMGFDANCLRELLALSAPLPSSHLRQAVRCLFLMKRRHDCRTVVARALTAAASVLEAYAVPWPHIPVEFWLWLDAGP